MLDAPSIDFEGKSSKDNAMTIEEEIQALNNALT